MNKENINQYSDAEWEMISNYITKKCSDKELLIFNSWLEDDPSRKLELELLEKAYSQKPTGMPVEKVDEAWNYVQDEINSKSGIHLVNIRSSSIINTKYLIRAAAVFLIIVGSYFIWDSIKSNIGSEKQVTWLEKSTALGEKAIINLLDGTTITVNADSKLKYPAQFNEKNREVYIEGEAFFEVAKDSSKPFIVHAKNLSTTVLGTKFNVKAFNNDNTIEVSLVEGRVRINNNTIRDQKGSIILSPMQQLVFSKTSESNSISNFDLQTETGWMENNLKFADESLSEIIPILERTYGVKFEVSDKSSLKKKITANFKNDSFKTVAEVLKKLTGLNYMTTKENNRIIKITFYKTNRR